MAETSAIEWTDATWNPVTGCSKVSPGCDHCYAEALSLRYGWSKKPWAHENAAENVVLKPHRLGEPLRWKKPRMVFVNSMSDLFHDEVPDKFIEQVFVVMARTPKHTFQVLTKRPKRMQALLSDFRTRNFIVNTASHESATELRLRGWEGALPPGHIPLWPLPNVWLGVSIESWRFNWRADVLREVPAAVRFISAEPLLDTLYGDRPLDLTGIHWLIVGGESGPRFRTVETEWVRELRDHATTDNVAFFFKQWGGRTPKAGGRDLDGRTWDQMPEADA